MSTSPPPPFAASAVIPTRNRRDVLRDVIRSLQTQTVPVEIIVVDDASTDGTEAMMRDEFPTLQYIRFDDAGGPCRLRNHGIAMATAAIVFPIDDDAVLVSPRTVEQTLSDFDDPRVGAVAIPFINVRHDQIVRHRSRSDAELYVIDEFVGASHAVRKDVFLGLGGYREHFFYMMEEADFCLRMLDTGLYVRMGRADPIEHVTSESRNRRRAVMSNAKNHLLFGWHNVPTLILPIYCMATVTNLIRFGYRHHHLGDTLRGIGQGVRQTASHWPDRKPVTRRTYLLSRRLKRSGGMLLQDALNTVKK